MYGRIKDGMLLAFDTCHDFIRTVPTLIADPMNPNDVLKGGEDHAGDECRYMCMARPYKKERPPVTRHYTDVQPLRFSDLKDVEIKRQQRWI